MYYVERSKQYVGFPVSYVEKTEYPAALPIFCIVKLFRQVGRYVPLDARGQVGFRFAAKGFARNVLV